MKKIMKYMTYIGNTLLKGVCLLLGLDSILDRKWGGEGSGKVREPGLEVGTPEALCRNVCRRTAHEAIGTDFLKPIMHYKGLLKGIMHYNYS